MHAPWKTTTITLLLLATFARSAERVDEHGFAQVWVPPGRFIMGSDEAALAELRRGDVPAWVANALANESPAHEVRISQGFWIDRFEVTNAAYRRFVDAGGYRDRALWSNEGWQWWTSQSGKTLPLECPGAEPAMPRRCVTWYEAEAYARWRGGRLPTEAEWEYAARGPAALVYPWGNTFDAARTNVIGSTGAMVVGSFANGQSWVGAHDLAGNAMEWVQDWLAPHAAEESRDPHGPATGRVKVEKGGWWGSNALVARSAYRHYEDPPEYQDHHIGFRVVSIAAAPTASATLDYARWLTGCWQLEGAPAGSIEQWTGAAGGMMLGLARTLRPDRAPFFEFMQIRTTADGSLEFVARPQGQTGATFGLISVRRGELVFENLANDFPQRVSYRPVSSRRVQARIEGIAAGTAASVDYALRRAPCADGTR